MRIVTRAEWRARPPKNPPTVVDINVRSAVCVHHDGDEPIKVGTLPEACALMRKDQDFHMGPARGYDDIGYNYLVISAPGRNVDGAILTGRGRDIQGAHCKNHNTGWIGVQVAIGGGQTPSPAALASVRWLHDTAAKAAGHHLAMVGHSDGFPTKCPGPQLLAWVRAGMPVTVSQSPSKPATKPIPTTVPTTPARPPTPVQEDDMPVILRIPGHHYISDGVSRIREISTPEAETAWLKAGVKVVPVPPGEVAAILAAQR